jgi:hypothetical protein
MTVPISIGLKWCSHCQRSLCITRFPVDRSRPDGRWHSCQDCNQRYWEERGKPRALDRKLDRRFERAQNGNTGLVGLKKYHNGSGFDGLPATLRIEAEQILSRSLARARAEGKHLSQPQIALRIACAVSNSWRVGDSSWRRRMARLKGYRRAERRKASEDARRNEIRTKNGEGKPRSKVLPIW